MPNRWFFLALGLASVPFACHLAPFTRAGEDRFLRFEKEDIAPADRNRNLKQVHVGLTADEVRTLLGPPDHSARQILYRRQIEQWQYDDLPGLWIEYDCLKGRDPRVRAVHAPGMAER